MALVLAVAFLVLNDEPVTLNDTIKQQSEGFHYKGSQGSTHFELTGPEGAPIVVLVHGVSGPMKVWDKTVTGLVAAGFRVLRYDLFGRGLSERVSGDYQPGLFDRQLQDLIGGLKLKTPLVLVGSSMGAIICTNFANQHPEMVKGLVLIGPAGFPIQATPAAALMGVPYVGEFMMGAMGAKVLPSHHQKYFVHPEKFPELHQAFEDQLKVKGTKQAILSTMRSMPVNDFAPGFDKVGRSPLPITLIWGAQDITFPYHHSKKARELMPQALFISVEGAAHLPQYEKPDEVNQRIIEMASK